jgi:hypothetical protein
VFSIFVDHNTRGYCATKLLIQGGLGSQQVFNREQSCLQLANIAARKNTHVNTEHNHLDRGGVDRGYSLLTIVLADEALCW